MRIWSLALITSTLTLPVVWAGEIVPCPVHLPGTKYAFSITGTGVFSSNSNRLSRYTVKDVQGDRLTFEGHDQGVPVDRDLMFNMYEKPTSGSVAMSNGVPIRHENLPSCPFELGSKKSYPISYSPGSRSGNVEIEVTPEYSTYNSPTGPVKVVKIVTHNSYRSLVSGLGAGGVRTITSFYSPELGIIVWQEWAELGRRNVETWVLQSIVRPQ